VIPFTLAILDARIELIRLRAGWFGAVRGAGAKIRRVRAGLFLAVGPLQVHSVIGGVG
jgi:hypothetical protein